MRHNRAVIGRRRFLAGGAALLASRGSAPSAETPPRLRLAYPASATARWLPPPLRPDRPERLLLEFGAEADGTFCQLALQARRNGEACLLPVAAWTADSRVYWRARESLGLPVFRGDVRWSAGQWTLTVNGREEFAVRVDSRGAADGPELPAPPRMAYRYALDPDWRQGPLAAPPPELWRQLARPAAPLVGIPVANLRTGGSLDGWLPRFNAAAPEAAGLARETAQTPFPGVSETFVRTIAPAEFEPFAFRAYRAGSLGLAPPRPGPAAPADLEAYRGRREIVLANLLIVSVDLVAFGADFADAVPPPCGLAPHPRIRVLTVRGLDDPDLDEAWLFVHCSLAGRPVWYAASHLRPSLDGAAFGREVFGYPTQGGQVDAALGANRFGSGARSQGRSLFQAAGAYAGFSTGTALGSMQVATLRLWPGSGDRSRSGELVIQPWYYQGLPKPVRLESVEARFPQAGIAQSALGVWPRVGAARPLEAAVFDTAVMQRRPGAVMAEVPNVDAYYRDRCEGTLPWAWRAANRQAQPSD